jgi:hypothetical protein
MLMTHYFSIVAIFALIFYALVAVRRRARSVSIAAMIAPMLLFALLWLPMIAMQTRTLAEPSGDEWIRVSEPHHVLQTLLRWCALPMRLMFEPPLRSYPVVYLAAAIFFIPLILARKYWQMRLWWMWLICTTIPIALLEIVRSTRHLEIIRYTVLAGPAVYALLPLLSRAAPRALRHALPAAAVLGCAISLPQAYPLWKSDYRSVAQFIDDHRRPGDAVVFSGSFDSQLFSSALMMGVSHYSRTYPWPFMILRGLPTREQVQTLQHQSGVWLISPGALGPDDVVPGGSVTETRSYAPFAVVDRIVPATQPASRF